MNAVLNIIKTCFSVLLIGVIGAMFYQTDAGNYFEEEVGLDWLFKIRGAMPPPSDVVIVSIDQASAEILHFPDDPENWPRSFYAQLIQRINQQNPAVIAFNLHFSESRDPKADQMLAKAMRAKKNVILSNYLKQDSSPDFSPIGQIRYEPIIEPIPLFSHAAFCSAPFPLPKTSSTVKEFWTHSSGGMSTFPVSIFQYFVTKSTYPEMLQLLSNIDPVLVNKLPLMFDQNSRQYSGLKILEDIHTAFTKDEGTIDLAEQLIYDAQYPPKIKELLRSWLTLFKSEQKLYLNHYGDVGTITTIPFYKVLATEDHKPELFKDKIVLVGYSDDIEPEKYQGFYTTFSKASGKVISPIEIAATAVANAIDQSWLKPLSMSYSTFLVLVWGIVLSVLFRLVSFKYAIITTLILTVAYCQYSSFIFSSENIWLPLAIPILQAGVVVLWQSTLYLLRLRTVSGTHLPQKVIDEITRKGKIEQEGILMHGVCMATDIDKYTSLSEEIGSRKIAKLINDYNAVIYPKISTKNGLILNNIGDAILAGWVSEKIDSKLRLDACRAALEIKSAIDSFNRSSKHPLMTRIGLHYGEMDMSFVGAAGRYEYRAVGDTVNTATRIEGLNKILGTRILVSMPVIEGLSEFYSRELGTFLLKGKLQTVTVSELMGTTEEIRRDKPHFVELNTLFSKAFQLYKSDSWEQALNEFRAIIKDYPEDGPTRFYISFLQNQLSLPLEQKNGKKNTFIIDVGNITT